MLGYLRWGGGFTGVGFSSWEDPDLEGSTLNLVLYMYLRIFTYSSNIFVTNFTPMGSMIASGTRKNLRFFLRSCRSGSDSNEIVGTLGRPVSVSKIFFVLLIPLIGLPLLASVLIVWRGVWSRVPLLCSRWSPSWYSVIVSMVDCCVVLGEGFTRVLDVA